MPPINKLKAVEQILGDLRQGVSRSEIWGKMGKSGEYPYKTFEKHYLEAKALYQAEQNELRSGLLERDKALLLSLPTKAQLLHRLAKIIDTDTPVVSGYVLMKIGESPKNVAQFQTNKDVSDAIKTLLEYHNSIENVASDNTNTPTLIVLSPNEIPEHLKPKETEAELTDDE